MSDPDRIRLIARVLSRINAHWRRGHISDAQRQRLYVYVLAEFAK